MTCAMRAFLAFTAIFAALAGFVFWGTWSLDVAPVMPDDALASTVGYGDVVRRVVWDFLKTGKLIPTDLIWKGLVVSPYFCQELKYVSGLYLAGLGLAYFLRGRGLGFLPSYGAGLLLAFCGYWSTLFAAGHGGWFIWMSYGVFAFGLVDRALVTDRPRAWLLLGAVLAWGSFAQPDMWLLFTVFTAFYFLFRWLSRPLPAPADGVRRWPAVPVKGLMLAALASGAIGAPSFYSALVNDLAVRDQQIVASEQPGGAPRTDAAAREKRWEFVTNWSLPPAETVEFFSARSQGDTSCPLTLALGGKLTGVRPYTGELGRPRGARSGNYRQHSLYVGWVTCLLALVGVVLGLSPFGRADRDARRTVIFFALAALVFWVFSWGRYCESVYRLVFALPMGDYLRAPVKWHHLTEFCLVVLAGYGLAYLARLSSDRRWRALLLAAVLFGAFDLARNDHLYCAPQPHNFRVQLADARALAGAEARQYLAQQGIRVLGVSNGLAVLGQRQAPVASAEPLPPLGWPFALGVVSLLSALGVAVYAWRRP